MPRGIPEVPMGIDSQLRRHLQDVREVLIELRHGQAPPSLPSNFKVTAQSFGNLLQWTRSTGADFYEVLFASTPQLQNAQVVPIGNASQWSDVIGQANVKRFYWIRAGKNTGARSVEVGPISGTSLASGTGVAPPTPPPASQITPLDQKRGYLVVPLGDLYNNK